MKVVFIAFEFPPLASGGSFRPVRLTKYLSKFGVEIDVITVRTEDYKLWSAAQMDGHLVDKIPADVGIYRIPSGFPSWYWKLIRHKLIDFIFRHIYWGDPTAVFWQKPLFNFFKHYMSKNSPDVMLVTVPPFGAAVLGTKLSEKYHLPIVIDWRDPWTLLCTGPFPSYFHYLYTRRKEYLCHRKASFSICTSHVTKQDWLNEFHGLDSNKMDVIYNGFDEDDFRDISVNENGSKEDLIRIVYVGSFYYTPESRAAAMSSFFRRPVKRWAQYSKRKEDWLYRSPFFFLKGLRYFADKYPELAKRLRVIFAGSSPEWLHKMLRDTKTQSFVSLVGFIPHAEAVSLQKSAQAVLLTSAKIENGLDYSIAGKLFEYMGMQKQILAVLTQGAMRDLVQKSGLGIMVDPDDTEQIADGIRQIVLRNDPKVSLSTEQRAFINSFSAERMARKMAEKLSLVVQAGKR